MYTSGAPLTAAGTAVLGSELVRSSNNAQAAKNAGQSLAYTGGFSLTMMLIAMSLIIIGFVMMGFAAKRRPIG